MSVEEIFAGAIEKQSQEERAAFLDGACGKDLETRRQVEALIDAHGGMESFLDHDLFKDRPTEALGRVTESEGMRIGNYKLLQKIGEGGFGVVYMAEQTEPVRRKVALKIIKPGMDTKEVVARFAAEKQALALMDHPNIAKVFDAGETESGRPYFVMELVKGVSVTDYCDANNLATIDRIQLFMSVCNAVQHAHQKGVIHRDIKPSNVLVTLHDGKPVAKVIDFGVSKAISQQLTEQTLFTRFGQVIGTPQYMSPEQAEMSGLDVDTRSDIYSLGVLLYELLTGRPPFDSETLRKAGFDEMRRLIREHEPAKPSYVFQTLDKKSATVVANHRASKPEMLSKACRGDLDLIVMKSLAKDRNRRYATATNLAEDLQRHLQNEPVQASPPGLVYLLGKSLSRHRVLWLTTASVFLALLVGVSVATVGWSRAIRMEQIASAAKKEAEVHQFRAVEQAEIAERAAQSANEQMEALVTVLSKAGRDPATGFEYKVSDALLEIDDLLAELSGDAKQRGLALDTTMRLHVAVGRSRFNDQKFDLAREHLTRALDAWRQARSDGGDTVDEYDGTAILSLLGACNFYQGKLDDAEAHLNEAIAMFPENYRPKSISEIPHVFRFWTLREKGALENAEEEKARVFESVASFVPWAGKSYPWNNIGSGLLRQNRLVLANEAFEMADKLRGSESMRLKEVAFVARAQGMPEKALELYQHNLELQRAKQNEGGITWEVIRKARVYCDAHDFATAENLLREAMEGAEPIEEMREYTRLAPARELAILLEYYGDRTSARDLHSDVAARIRNQQEMGEEVWYDVFDRVSLAKCDLYLSEETTLSEWLPRIDAIEKDVEDPLDHSLLDRMRGLVYERAGDLKSAIKWYEEAASNRVLFNEVDNGYWVEAKLLDLYRQTKDRDRAIDFFTRLVNRRARDCHPNHPTQAFTRILLARAVLDREVQSPKLASVLQEAKRVTNSHSLFPSSVKEELAALISRSESLAQK